MRQTEKKHKILESTSISQECDNNILQGKKEVQQNVQQTEKKGVLAQDIPCTVICLSRHFLSSF